MTDRLRIVLLSALSTDSGSYLRARYLANALERAGAEVRLLPGVRSLPWMLDYPISLVSHLRALAMPCDVVIGLKPLPNVTLPLYLKKRLGAFTVLDVDDMDWGYRTGLLSRVNRALQLPMPRRCAAAVTYHADALRPFVIEEFGVPESRLVQLPQGVDLHVFSKSDVSALAAQVRREHGLEGRRLVVYPAHLNRASELPCVLEIVRRARASVPGLHLLVIGGGPLYSHFLELTADSGLVDAVTFTGWVAPEMCARLMQLGEVGVVYHRDTPANGLRASMKLREMLALELPVVCNDVGELRRFADVTYQSAGDDPGAVAATLVALLQSGSDGRELRGARAVRDQLDWDRLGRGLLREIGERMAAQAAARSQS